jgi:predicted transport protein
MRLWLKLDPDSLTLEEGFSRDVRSIGHWGTGDLEIVVRTQSDFEKARPLIERSYQEN